MRNSSGVDMYELGGSLLAICIMVAVGLSYWVALP